MISRIELRIRHSSLVSSLWLGLGSYVLAFLVRAMMALTDPMGDDGV